MAFLQKLRAYSHETEKEWFRFINHRKKLFLQSGGGNEIEMGEAKRPGVDYIVRDRYEWWNPTSRFLLEKPIVGHMMVLYSYIFREISKKQELKILTFPNVYYEFWKINSVLRLRRPTGCI